MSKGLIPPVQLYPTENGELEIELTDEHGDEQYTARNTLTREQVRQLISILIEWHDREEE